MSTAAVEGVVARELAAICGEAHVVQDPALLQQFAIDELSPAFAISPGSAEEVAAVLRVASDHGLCVVPSGGFTAQHIGEIPERSDILLRTTRLNHIEHYDPGDLTIGLGAGCTLANISARLAENHQFLPLEVPHPHAITIGGLLARNPSYPLRHSYGSVRDYCIGIQFATGDGKLAKGGGRVVKNVAGFDLMKLLIGSYGTLGLITGANFKVFPRPDRHGELRTFVLEFASQAESINARDRIVSSPLTPLCLEIVSPSAHEYLHDSGPPRDADDFVPERPVNAGAGRWALLVRAAGSHAILARYRRELASTRELGGDEERKLWERVVNFPAAIDARHQNPMLLCIEVQPSLVKQALEVAQRVATDNNFVLAAIGRVAIASLTLALLPLSVDPPSAMQYTQAVSAIRAALPVDTCVIALRAPAEAKRHFSVWGSSPTDHGSMLAVKRALDPLDILNRGRFLV